MIDFTEKIKLTYPQAPKLLNKLSSQNMAKIIFFKGGS